MIIAEVVDQDTNITSEANNIINAENVNKGNVSIEVLEHASDTQKNVSVESNVHGNMSDAGDFCSFH